MAKELSFVVSDPVGLHARPATILVNQASKFTSNIKLVYNDKEVIEKSSGTFKIENDELTYYRKEITINKDNLKIPSETHFVVRNNKLILKDDTLFY